MKVAIKAHKRLLSNSEELPKGVYISQEKPEFVDSPEVGEIKAILPGKHGSFVWRKEYPKMLVRTKKLHDLMKYLPAIFGHHTSAKLDAEATVESTGFVFTSDNHWLVVSVI